MSTIETEEIIEMLKSYKRSVNNQEKLLDIDRFILAAHKMESNLAILLLNMYIKEPNNDLFTLVY